MLQLVPQFFENVDKRQIAESLRIDMNGFDDNMQP